MSSRLKDALIMGSAGIGVGLLVLGTEMGAPVVAGTAAAITGAATIVKLIASRQEHQQEVKLQASAKANAPQVAQPFEQERQATLVGHS